MFCVECGGVVRARARDAAAEARGGAGAGVARHHPRGLPAALGAGGGHQRHARQPGAPAVQPQPPRRGHLRRAGARRARHRRALRQPPGAHRPPRRQGHAARLQRRGGFIARHASEESLQEFCSV